MNTIDTNIKPVIVGFFHSWSADGKLHSPYHAIAKSITDLGYDLKIIWSNELISRKTGMYGFGAAVSETKIINKIKELNPVLVLSMNNGGMTRNIRNSIKCPVVRWLFDDIPHLFIMDGIDDLEKAFGDDDFIVCYNTSIQKEIIKLNPKLSDKVLFLPHATDYNCFKKNKDAKFNKNINFVGSFLETNYIIRVLTKYHKQNPDLAKKIALAVSRLKENYFLDFKKLVADLELESFLENEKMNWLEFKLVLCDVLSSEERYQGVQAIADLGLKIYGGTTWISPILLSEALLSSFQFGVQVDTQEKLAEVYQTSKITVDLPNIQNAQALSGRVIDAMASQSLLITKFQEKSDIFSLFGKDHPIPMYKNPKHLRELCEYYLNNEEARLAAVQACNKLVEKNFDFEDRVRQVLSLASLKTNTELVRANQGAIEYISSSNFKKIFCKARLLGAAIWFYQYLRYRLFPDNFRRHIGVLMGVR